MWFAAEQSAAAALTTGDISLPFIEASDSAPLHTSEQQHAKRGDSAAAPDRAEFRGALARPVAHDAGDPHCRQPLSPERGAVRHGFAGVVACINRRRSAELRNSWGAGADTPVAIHVGRLAPEKNLGALVSAYEAIGSLNPEIKLVCVGDGPAMRDCSADARARYFAGIRTGVDLAAHYASGDLFLFPSTTETFGNVTPEAMASGVAVLAYDYAAAAQLIQPRVNGLLAPFDDREAFVRLSVELVADLSIARAMGARARATAERLSWERVVERLERLFFQVIAQSDHRYVSVRSTGPVPTPADL